MSGLEELNNVLEQKNLLGYWNFVRHDSASEEPTPFFKSCCGSGRTFRARLKKLERYWI